MCIKLKLRNEIIKAIVFFLIYKEHVTNIHLISRRAILNFYVVIKTSNFAWISYQNFHDDKDYAKSKGIRTNSS